LKFEIFSLEWLKLNNNKLRTLPYELVEPILDTVKHIDIHGKGLGILCPKQWTPSFSPHKIYIVNGEGRGEREIRRHLHLPSLPSHLNMF
jgi:hypothetical protein